MKKVYLEQLQQMSPDRLHVRSIKATIDGATRDLLLLGLKSPQIEGFIQVFDEGNWDSLLQEECGLSPKMVRYAAALLVFLKEERKIKK